MQQERRGQIMKVLVYGAGVIGSIYAMRLHKAGFQVSLLARGERLEALRSSGLRICHVFLGAEESASLEVIEELDGSADYDIILVALRSGQVTGSLQRIAARSSAKAVLVIGNNLEDLGAEAEAIGPERLVLGFGAFGGYREGTGIAYLDGRTKEKPQDRNIGATTIGILDEAARPALEAVRAILESAGLPCRESPDISSYLLCHAALVFPLAGAIFAAGSEQGRFCRTRDALVLGIRACREAIAALRSMGVRLEPASLRKLLLMPEWLLVATLAKGFAGEAARVAMFGHARAAGGREEIGGQARVLDGKLRLSGKKLPDWDRLLPWFDAAKAPEPLPDGSRSLRLRLW
jgi:2-dehydropantoate 2-reductase